MKGGGRVGVGEDDNGDGMQCIDHPYRNNPGGICAFCLQEKLGKLVSSSFPLPLPSSSSSSSPSFRSDNIASSSSTSTIRPICPSITTTAVTTTSASVASSSSLSIAKKNDYHSRRTRLPFLLAKKKKNKPSTLSISSSAASASTNSNIILKRSKSTATPRRGHSLDDEDFTSPRKRNTFWSFLYHSSKSSSASSSSKKLNSKSFRDGNINNNVTATTTTRISTVNAANGLTAAATAKLKDKCCSGSSLEEDSPNSHTTASSFERKVSRSRSVGCGSRSFSGDFFERISTGFGDCTLRRVESQREGKHKVASGTSASGACMKERVRCGGLFSGFMMTSSSSSSSSSSYWVSSSADDGKPALSHNRGKSWGWAFASPMRAFSTKPSSNNKRDIIRDANDNNNNNKNATPNLSAIPSLLSARA